MQVLVELDISRIVTLHEGLHHDLASIAGG